MMEVAYISGKYRGKTIAEIEENIALARRAAKKLWKDGYAVICPHMNTAFLDGVVADDRFLEADIEILKRCDVVFMLPNWRQSEGAKKERECAHGRMMPVLYLSEEEL